MRGWFDAFRENGGPTLYSFSNRTPVTADVSTLTLYIVFLTLFLAFIIIFPGVRRQRFTTFTSVALSLFVGTAILRKIFKILSYPIFENFNRPANQQNNQ